MAYIGNDPKMNETVTSAEIVDGAIVNADVSSSAAIAFSKMADLTASRLLVSDGNGDVSVSDVTSAEALLLDGGTSATSTTLAAADRLIVNDNGTIVQVALSDFETFFEGAIDTLSSAMTFSSTVTVGSDGSGQDVIFYSGTSGDNLTWDSSEECLTITGTDGAQALKVADGDLVVVDKIYLNDNDGGEYISGDGTDLTITSGRHIVLALGSAGSVYHTGDGGTSNTIYGKDAGIALDSGGNYNVFLGENAGEGITVADDNVAIGYNAFYRATTQADKNVAIGSNAMSGNFTTADVDSCVVVGYDALSGALTTDADGTIAIGHQAGKSITEAQNSTIVGYQAGDAITDGDYNTLFGHSAGTNLTSGGNNIAIGSAALRDHQDGHRNIAIGGAAMYLTQGTTADGSSENIAIGYQAMGGDWANTTSEWNIAMGNYAMDAAMDDANYNTAIGHHALGALTQADGNTAIGYYAGFDHLSGNNNVFIGKEAAQNTTDAHDNVIIGVGALAQSTSAGGCVIIGRGACNGGNVTSNGDGTIAIGHNALENLASASAAISNVAIGREAGNDVTTGVANVIVGDACAEKLTTGRYNTAIGKAALGVETIGDRSVAIGYEALYKQNSDSNNEETQNVGIGMYAGYNNVTGKENTYVGYGAGFGASGNSNSYNTAIGNRALYVVSTGEANNCFGTKAGDSITTGDNNTCIGYEAGEAVTTGSGNIMIGHTVDVDDGDAIDRFGIGHSFTVNTDNRCHIGDGGYRAELYFGTSGESWGSTSDERIKKNIVDTDLGLDFVNKLRPIKYQDKPTSEHPESFNIQNPKDTASDKVLDGLLAQEVKSATDDLGTTFSGWSENPKTTKQRLQYEKFVLPLIKAVQELSQQVEDLKKKVG